MVNAVHVAASLVAIAHCVDGIDIALVSGLGNQFHALGDVALFLFSNVTVEVEDSVAVMSLGSAGFFVVLGGFLVVNLHTVHAVLINNAKRLGGHAAALLVALDKVFVAGLAVACGIVEHSHPEVSVGLTLVNHLLEALGSTVVVAVVGIETAKVHQRGGVAILVGFAVVLHSLGHILVFFAFIKGGEEHGTLSTLALVGTALAPIDSRVGVLFAARAVVKHETHEMACFVLHLIHFLFHSHLVEIGQCLGIAFLLIIETAQAHLALRAAEGIALQPIAHGLGTVAQSLVRGVHVIETCKRLGVVQCVVLCHQRVEQVLGLCLVFRHTHTAPIELYRCCDGIRVSPLHAFLDIFPSLLSVTFIYIITCQAYGGIGFTQFEGFLVICQSLFHILLHTADAIKIVVAQKVIAPRGAFFHSLLIQLVGLGSIDLATNAVLIATAQSSQTVGQPLVSPLLADGKTTRSVLGHKRTAQVILGNAQPCLAVAEVCCLAEPLQGKGGVVLHTGAVLVALAQPHHGGHVALMGFIDKFLVGLSVT